MKNYKVIQTTFYSSTPSERNYSKFSPKTLLQFAQEFMMDEDDYNEEYKYTSQFEQTGESQVFVTEFLNGEKHRQFEIIDLHQETIFNCSLEEFKNRLTSYAMKLEETSPKQLITSLYMETKRMVEFAQQELMPMEESSVRVYDNGNYFCIDVDGIQILSVEFKRSSKEDTKRWRTAKLHFVKSIEIKFYYEVSDMEELFKSATERKHQLHLESEKFKDQQYAKFLDCVDKKDFFGAYKIFNNLSYSEKQRYEEKFETLK